MHLGHLLYLIFFLSGAAALVFESLWFFQAGLALGNSIWASSLVLASFMAGLAVGNAWVSFRGQAIQRPVRLYAGLEIVIAITGTRFVFGLPAITPERPPARERTTRGRSTTHDSISEPRTRGSKNSLITSRSGASDIFLLYRRVRKRVVCI